MCGGCVLIVGAAQWALKFVLWLSGGRGHACATECLFAKGEAEASRGYSASHQHNQAAGLCNSVTLGCSAVGVGNMCVTSASCVMAGDC